MILTCFFLSFCGRRQYSVTSVDDNGLANEMAALVIDYVYPPSPPNAKPRLTLKYRQFLKRKEKGGLFRIPRMDD